MSDQSELDWLQNWYRSQCNGLWEHSSGVDIGTLDNPGWTVDINLAGTSSSGLTHEKLKIDSGDDNWLVCWIEDEKFKGRGDALKLGAIISVFRNWSESASPHA